MKTVICLAGVLGALMGVCAGGCGGPEWTSYGIGGGGGIFVPVSSPHDPKLMFCASDMSGVYRSADGGRHWRMVDFRQTRGSTSCRPVFHPI
ncbi:hypothetical protein LCGC14_2083070, partial [marine sediment metagenome]